jgi:ribosome biogenesis protein BMS1
MRVLEPRDKKAYTVLQQIQTIKRERQKKRKIKQHERVQKHVRHLSLSSPCVLWLTH